MEKHIKIVTNFSKLMDEQFKIGPFKFGLDPLVGLIPGLGDILPAALSCYLIWIAWVHELPKKKIIKMVFNILLDLGLGLIPIIGNITDFFFKSNTKNLEILKSHLEEPLKGKIME